MDTRMSWILIKTYNAKGYLSRRQGFNLVHKSELDYCGQTEHGQEIMPKLIKIQMYSGFLRTEPGPQLQTNRVLL
jgi:hypothetical protein